MYSHDARALAIVVFTESFYLNPGVQLSYLAIDLANSRLIKHLYLGASNWVSLPTVASSCNATRLLIYSQKD